MAAAAISSIHGVPVSRSDSSALEGAAFTAAFQPRSVYPRGLNATDQDAAALAEALKLVQDASQQQGDYNAHRVANPKRNEEVSKDSPAAQAARRKRADDAGPRAPTLTPALRKAAALVAEHQARLNANKSAPDYPPPKYINFKPQADSNYRNSSSLKARAEASYWLQDIKHTGLAPMGANSSWPVFRDVTDPKFAGGAKGDGVHDDTEAINAAIAYGGNCGEGCLSSSIKGTLIYFPPGKYLISTPINAMYYSQLVGNPNSMPTIITSKDFVGLGAIQSDVYIPNQSGGEWYIEQSNFYRQVRNLVVDIRQTTTDKAAAFHWQVAQATSMTNVHIYASTDAGTTQMGLFTENGSGGFMSDVFIKGGKYGIYGGNQQYTVRDFEIDGQTDSCVALIWDWGWTWYRLYLSGAPNGFSLLNPEQDGASKTPTGSIYVMDSMFQTKTGIKTGLLKKEIKESTIIQLDNIHISEVDTMISATDGSAVQIPSGANINHVVVGNVKIGGESMASNSIDVDPPSQNLLNQLGSTFVRYPYFVKKRPQYEDMSLGDIINVKDHGAKGDGVTDDTAAINAVMGMASATKLIYFPAGSYIVTGTINVPAHALITGEVWSQIVAQGSFFNDMKKPQPMVKVGNSGDRGTVEISDMLFTSIGSLPGLVLVEWNVAADGQGSVGMFDTHFRVGGAYGSKLSIGDCPKVTTIPSGCVAASMLLHVTPKANGYFENVWGWVADHDLDDPQNTMVTVVVARGFLIESAIGPTWLYGTASEHSMLYQYNFFNTSSVFAGMIQTESPYFQGTDSSSSPGPFKDSLGVFNNDPTFTESCEGNPLQCNMSWAVMFNQASNVTVAGAGLYSWFDAYDQSVCVDAQNCQQRLIFDQGENAGLWVFNLVTIGAVEMISEDTGAIEAAKPNTQANSHPFWSALAVWGDESGPDIVVCDDDSPDCVAELPCDLTKDFDNMDALAAAQGSFPDECAAYYVVPTLANSLETSLAAYDDANKGYDDVWDDYAGAFRDSTDAVIQKFVAQPASRDDNGGPGNKYFDCTITLDGSPTTKQCPFSFFELSFYDSFDMKYTLRDANGFYDELNKTYSIPKDWVTFVDHDFGGNGCVGGAGGSHPGNGIGNPNKRRDHEPESDDTSTHTPALQKRCGHVGERRFSFPGAKSNFDVPNPKTVIVNSTPKMYDLDNQLRARQFQLGLGEFNGSVSDIGQALSLPVFMMAQSIESMKTAKAMGQKIRKQKHDAFIQEIISIVFMFIPFIDEFTPELLFFKGMATGLGFLGGTALGIKDMIDHPENAFMDIIGIVTDAAFLRTGKGYKDAAAARRGMDGALIEKSGKTIKQLDDKMQDFLGKTCSK
ncbi:LysM domain-containing protein [Akanthomyces lecanii RCEF 1005]|uniref:LysM domain-containing protein n=1 Tax=Akanthomyces lecanii RCEF 1005 TaxID=1081108 RepID=A0A162JKA2_CORDF|nr:LysM domain-containing protein [Akanthomyces lecanii RCEF 1005]